MVGYYRLKDFGFTLSRGAHILRREDFEPVEAASALLEAAQARAASVEASAGAAYERERQRGYEEGQAKAQREATRRLIGESAVLDARLAGLETELSAIVAAAVRRLIEDFDDDARATQLVRTALGQMRREKKAELRVSSAQFAGMKARMDDFLADFPGIDFIDVIEDETLTAPNIVLESAIGHVSGDFAFGLEALEEAIRAAGATP